MSKIYVVTQQEDEEQLADVLLLLVAIQGLVTCTGQHIVTVSQDCYSCHQCHKIVIGGITYPPLSQDSHQCHNTVISFTRQLFVSTVSQVCHHCHKTHWCHWYHKIGSRVARLSVSPDRRLCHQSQRIVISHLSNHSVTSSCTLNHNQSSMYMYTFLDSRGY